MAGPTFTAEQQAAHTSNYERMLVERYRAGLPMPKADEREAERLILCNEGVNRRIARIRRAEALAKTEA